MKLEDIKNRLEELLNLVENVLSTEKSTSWGPEVSSEIFIEFQTSCLSFLGNVFGFDHPFYTTFKKKCETATPDRTKIGRGILKAVKKELDGGWIFTVKGLVSAEIFSDFLEMAEYLLQEKYKDPAAVMVSSVLEEHLRQLCNKNGIDINKIKNGKPVPKKADLLNSELASDSVYSNLDQKSITAWLDLRNKAAHGRYYEYTQEQVLFMLQSVTDFIARTT
ncbi:MAG: hypothetical protein P9M09_03590 [Candidatus Celaenobacter antarcticus]|nr:hypothetical protein [Candidatus Celaenobacter antarcticus]